LTVSGFEISGHFEQGSSPNNDFLHLRKAAHCYDSFADYGVVGAYQFDRISETVETKGTAAERIAIKRRVVHPEFDIESRRYDMMVVVLQHPSNKTPVLLNQNPDNPGPDQPLTAIGLGSTSPSRYAPPKILKQVTLRNVPVAVCQRALRREPVSIHRKSMICAYAGRLGSGDYKERLRRRHYGRGRRRPGKHNAGPLKNVCYGDSGASLLDDDGTLVGLVSFGEEPCVGPRLHNISMFSRVSGSVEWIEEMVCKWSKHPPSFCDYDNSQERDSTTNKSKKSDRGLRRSLTGAQKITRSSESQPGASLDSNSTPHDTDASYNDAGDDGQF